MPEETCLPVSPSVLSSPSAGSMQQHRISSLSSQFVISVIEESQLAINQGSRIDGITRGSPFRKKLGDNARGMRQCIVVQKTPGYSFLKLSPNAMNSNDQSLSHFLIKFTVYNVFFRHKFGMNNTFSIKMQSTLFSPVHRLATTLALL
jgi:hypothetical protein